MRRKFFLISLLVLLASTLSVSAVLLTYFKSERLSLLDEQIRQSATSVVDSKFSHFRTYDEEEAEQLISDELGPRRLGKFFVIRNSAGDILFQTQNISLLEIEVPKEPQWVSLQVSNYFVRVLNLKLPRVPNRTLQVGAIVDEKFLSLTYVTQRTWIAISCIFVIILIFTWFLSANLFSPIRSLSTYLKKINKNLENHDEIPSLPPALLQYNFKSALNGSDEFASMMKNLVDMVDRINVTRKFMRSWSFQMAHELKTPLTILNRDFETVSEKFNVDRNSILEIQKNINKISETVSSFLDWAELTSRKNPGNLYVISIGDILTSVSSGLMKIYGARIKIISGNQDFQVMCNPLHLEQLIVNILQNALKYSTDDVEVEIGKYWLLIKDKGPGIPRDVLSRIGSPFNKSFSTWSEQKGVGLGLAWVKTICELYQWKFEIQDSDGTHFLISFMPLATN